jgi:nicotinamidase-related amidase
MHGDTHLAGMTSSAPVTLRSLYGLAPRTHLETSRTSLLLVDFQQEFFPGGGLPIPLGDACVARGRVLLEAARAAGLRVVHVRNVAARPDAPLFRAGTTGTAFVSALTPRDDETVVTKSMAGAFTRTELSATLEARGIDTVIVAGIMTHLAVDSTVRDAAVLGHHVIVATDATATRDLPGVDHRTLQRAALAALADRFADVAPVDSIISRFS